MKRNNTHIGRIIPHFISLLVMLAFVLGTGMVNAQTSTAPGGSGSSSDPYQIATLDNLYWLSQTQTAWDKHFIQTSDIDASATAIWPGGAGFEPIGRWSPNHFSGTYDGNGYKIDGLYINYSGFPTGLFGYTAQATFKNIALCNVDVRGMAYTGALVGRLQAGTMQDCYSTGKVYSQSFVVGGLVGNLFGHPAYGTPYMYRCWSSCDVQTLHQTVGGLVGHLQTMFFVEDCFSTGSVSSTINVVGGFAGRASVGSFSPAIIKNCYSTSPVLSEYEIAGGFIGWCRGTGNRGQMENCYSAGLVTVNQNRNPLWAGGFVGSFEPFWGSVSGSYWDKESSGQNASMRGTGKTTAEMMAQATFTGWDFTSTWEIDEGNSYPGLLSTGTNLCDITNTDPDCSGAAIADQIPGVGCEATISAADVTGITDADGDPLTITVSPTTLYLGANTVTVNADDGNGGTCSAQITVNVVGTADSDCDGVPDECDVCPGGDDSYVDENGVPYCLQVLNWADYPADWQCGKNKVYVAKVSANGNPHTICVNINALQAHLNNGDYAGPLAECSTPEWIGPMTEQNVKSSVLESELSVFPNPASSELFISITAPDSDFKLEIIDQMGRVVWTESISKESSSAMFTADLSIFDDGIYFVRARLDGAILTKRIAVLK